MRQLVRNTLLMALVLSVEAVPADDLGRLFSTPMERARIDDIRAGRQPVDEAVDAEVIDQMILNGTLTGSDGKRLAWVNGMRVDPDLPSSDLTLLYDGRARLHWRGGQAYRTLKPGQGVDKATGEVFELFDRPAPAAVTENAMPVTDAAEVK